MSILKENQIISSENISQTLLLKRKVNYNLQGFQRSNQDTCLVHKPAIFEGEWVQPGDLIADCSSSFAGELSLGQNIFIAYMPWEGYNYEDAILISERLVYEDLYTSIHIEKYEVETSMTKYGYEEITKQIPDLPKETLSCLDENGIINVGSFVFEGDILVGKVTPIEKKYKSPYQKLLYNILEKELASVRDSSLRAPKGLRAKVIERKIFEKKKDDIFLKNQKNQKIVHLYLAEKRRLQVGDKMAGRHGNKGIISKILPIQDMPYLPDGSPIDMVLNPLGVPSRMNVGQIYECLLGLASKYLGQAFRVRPFDEMYGSEASRTLTFSSLYQARLKTGHKWLFNPKSPGKMKIYDGRTGLPFHQTITVGISYMLKLVHLVDDKIHCLTPDHDVLTTNGWIPISQVTTDHQVATLVCSTGQLVYQKPLNILNYPHYNGDLYHIKNANLDVLVTLNHRMLVKKGNNDSKSFADYSLIEAKDIVGKHYQYLKNAEWSQKDYQFILPPVISNSLQLPERKVNMDSWLTFFGFWIAEGWAAPRPLLAEQALARATLEAPVPLEQPALCARSEAHARSALWHWLRQSQSQTAQQTNEITPKNATESFEDLTSLSENISDLSEDLNKDILRKLNSKAVYQVQISLSLLPLLARASLFRRNQSDQQVKDALCEAATSLGYKYHIVDDKITIHDKQLWAYLSPLSVGAPNKFLPPWVWELSQTQAQKLLHALCLSDGTLSNTSVNYYTSSIQLADDVMRLALHAGWSGNKYIHTTKGSESKIEGRKVISNYDLWCVSLIKEKNNPAVNEDHNKKQNVQVEEIVTSYKGSIHCLTVPNEVFYIRRNGLPVWTGNSRSTGPYSLVSQQPLRGRSKFGGQRLGEMEVWAFEGYGAAFTLLEMLTIKSDDITGRMTLWSNLILHNPIYIGTPESFKVLVCELQALCLDIGLFKFSKTSLRK